MSINGALDSLKRKVAASVLSRQAEWEPLSAPRCAGFDPASDAGRSAAKSARGEATEALAMAWRG